MNNAGVMAIPTREVTVDQYERTFQTNHLGPFALTSLLIPWMNTQSPVRIVNVSSAAYLVSALNQKGLDLDNLNSDLSYDPWEAYGKSKLENILFTKELQRRFDEKQLPWEAVALHPGAVRTDLARYILGEKDFVPMKEMNNQWNVRSALQRLPLLPLFYFTKSVQRGASCQIWLAAGQGQNVKGKFYQNCKEVTLAPAAMDMDKAKKLWELSEQWSGFHFNI
jgi:NAD(P)-dependent dehydrogenase (short-subunit alcohol dehydrogenase family)